MIHRVVIHASSENLSTTISRTIIRLFIQNPTHCSPLVHCVPMRSSTPTSIQACGPAISHLTPSTSSPLHQHDP